MAMFCSELRIFTQAVPSSVVKDYALTQILPDEIDSLGGICGSLILRFLHGDRRRFRRCHHVGSGFRSLIRLASTPLVLVVLAHLWRAVEVLPRDINLRLAVEVFYGCAKSAFPRRVAENPDLVAGQDLGP